MPLTSCMPSASAAARASVKALEGVVVGQRQHPNAVLERTRDQCRGRQGAIGGRAVAVQIDIHEGVTSSQLALSHVIDVCYYAATSSFWLLL